MKKINKSSNRTYLAWRTWLAYAVGIILAFLVLRYARNPLNLCSDIWLNSDAIYDLARRRKAFRQFINEGVAWSPFERALNLIMDYLFDFVMIFYFVSDVAVWLIQTVYAAGSWLYCHNYDLILIYIVLRKRRR